MWFLQRMSEGSSHAGIAAASQALKFFAPQWGGVLDAVTGLCGAVAFALADKK